MAKCILLAIKFMKNQSIMYYDDKRRKLNRI